MVCGCLGDISLLVDNQPKQAYEYFSQSLKEEKDNELLEVKIGVCFELLGKNDEALKHYKKSYDLNNEFPASIFHIGAIYDKQNNKEAVKWFQMAYEKEKENVEYLRKYGDILVRSEDKEQIEKGILILEKGLEFFIGNVDIMSSLAIGYEKQGRLKEAIQLLELANNNELYVRMFLEFFMETDLFEILPKYISISSSSSLDKYIYINLTKYMINGNLYDIILNKNLLKMYIKYYLNKNDKLLLNKVLLKLNLDSLLQDDILKIIMDNELINPYIYTRIKNIIEGKIDYFLPDDYLLFM